MVTWSGRHEKENQVAFLLIFLFIWLSGCTNIVIWRFSEGKKRWRRYLLKSSGKIQAKTRWRSRNIFLFRDFHLNHGGERDLKRPSTAVFSQVPPRGG